jgi:hypothetical protein
MTRMGEYVRIEWATILEKSEWACTCTTRMGEYAWEKWVGEYVRIERATILEKIEGACTSRNGRVLMDRMRHYT